MQSRHKSVLSSKAIPFHPKPDALPPNFLTHTALVPPPPQVPKGLHHFLARSVELWSQMDLFLVPASAQFHLCNQE